MTQPLLDLAPAVSVSLVIYSVNRDKEVIAPKTKKNSPQIIPHLGRSILVPSAAYTEWERGALSELVKAGVIERYVGFKTKSGNTKPVKMYRWLQSQPIDFPVNCCARIYRNAEIGDATGYYDAIADLLQKAGIVANDRYITQWDGTRLLKDAARPRVEVTLTEVR